MSRSFFHHLLSRSPCTGRALHLVACLVLAALGVADAQVPAYLLRETLMTTGELQSDCDFGRSVAMDGNYVVVGAPRDSTYGRPGAGIVKVFDATTGALLHTLKETNTSSNDSFGNAVAISGTMVVVGVPSESTGATYAGVVRIFDLSSATPTVPVISLLNPTPVLGDHFGDAVAISGTRVVVGTPLDDTNATDAGSAYVYDLSSGTPTTPVATLTDPAATASDQFGCSVAVLGTQVVVGACYDDTGAFNSGKVYVFDLNSGTPTVPTVTLTNPTPGSSDGFGAAISFAGSYVAVGTYGDDTAKTNAGAAYIFDLLSGTPTVPVHTLLNPNLGNTGNFGTSLKMVGTRLVVGVTADTVAGFSNAGAAHLYDVGGATPTVPVHTFLNPTPATGDNFGASVYLSGTTVVAGAPGDNTGAADAGSVYVYDLNSGTPTVPVKSLNDPGPEMDNQYGYSVAVSGSYVVVGVPRDAPATVAGDIGVAYVYDRNSATPQVPVFTLQSPSTAGTTFGTSVAISGSLVAVGAPYNNTGATYTGAVHVYDLGSSTPSVPVHNIYNPDPAQSDFFGMAVAISGTRIVAGANLDDTNMSDAGSAYVYDVSTATPTVPVAILNNPEPESSDNFGNAVAISGSRVVVGAKNDDTGSTNAGSAYIYDVNSATPTVPIVTLHVPNPAVSDLFGSSVTIDGSLVAVGAIYEDTGASNTGTVFIYDLLSGTPTVPVRTLNNPSPASLDLFGSALAMSGTRLVVGTMADDTGASDTGCAYVYQLAGNTPAVPVMTLLNPTPGVSDNFGYAVGMDGTTIAIGVPYSDITGRNQGAAYVYTPPSTNANLSSLTLSVGELTPGFSADTTSYTTDLPPGTTTMTVTATKVNAGASIAVNEGAVVSGTPSGDIALSVGDNDITVEVTAEDGVTIKTYNVTAALPGSGTLAFSSSVYTVTSGVNPTEADIAILRTVSSAGSVSCKLDSADGSAISPDQYAAQVGASVSLAHGVSEQHVLIPIPANATTTTAKVFTITLGNVSSGANLGAITTAFVVILPPGSTTDKVKPAVTITAPVKNATIVDTVPVTISGTATDNIGVSKVQVSVNNGLTYNDAALANIGGTTTAYSLDIQPLPGLNKITVRSFDFKGNISALTSQTFTHLRTLTVGMVGPALSGSVSSGFMPTSIREAGKPCSITAAAKPGFVFDGWNVANGSGSGITEASAELAKLDFIMQPGLGLTAKFIEDPFKVTVAGDFSGLIMPSGNAPAGGTVASHATVGFCSAKLTTKASLTGSVKMDGLTLPFSAVCDNTGVARFGKTRAKTLTLIRPGKSPLTLALKVELSGVTKQLTGTVTDLYRGDVLAESSIIANRHAYNGKTSSVPPQYVKLYTARLKARVSQGAGFSSQDYPQGDGFLTFQIKANGTVTMAGKLADDTPVTFSAALSQANHWPIFQQLYKNKGCIAADAVLDDTQNDTDATAIDMLWFRPFQEVQWYPYGWKEGIYVDMLASKYTPPSASVFTGLGLADPTVGNTDLVFTQGLLANAITKYVNLTTDNKVALAPLNDKSFTFKPTFATGLISGMFTHANNTKPTWQGVLMQKGANKGGHGYFMSAKPAVLNYQGESGKVEWTAK